MRVPNPTLNAGLHCSTTLRILFFFTNRGKVEDSFSQLEYREKITLDHDLPNEEDGEK